MASIVSAAIVSGVSISASSGTDGASFSVSVIMRERSLARHHFRMTQPLHLHGVVRKGHRVDLLEQRTNVVLDLRVAFRMDDELLAAADITHVAIFDNDRAGLDDVARVRKEESVIGIPR